MNQHGVNDLPTTEPTLGTLRLSKAQKHALYTLIASYKPELEFDSQNPTAHSRRYVQGYNQALQDYDNAIKELFNGLGR